tara:strand:- start:5442 stop:6278 length:837 start_codon:yes stop_codon:yes gene_type:complete
LAQITTNNALPVGKSKGILRIQSKIIRATNDSSDLNRELLVQVFPVVGVYGITQKLTVFGVFPILNKSLTQTKNGDRFTRSTDFGLSDIRLFARYDLFRKTGRETILSLSAFGRLELPTGADNLRDDRGRLPQPLQRGTGSTNSFGGLVLTYQSLEWFFTGSSSYQINTQANNFEFGDTYRLDAVAKYRLLARELSTGVSGFFYLVMESNLIWQDENVFNNSTDRNSGGTIWFLDPGLQYITKKFIIEGIIQVPVNKKLNRSVLENDFITTISLRMNL